MFLPPSQYFLNTLPSPQVALDLQSRSIYSVSSTAMRHAVLQEAQKIFTQRL